jgi:hypothetical protein
LTPAPTEAIERTVKSIGALPADLESLYLESNGLRSEWFAVLPIEVEDDPKRTWDGLCRANKRDTTRFLKWDPELLLRFIVFCEIGGGRCAVISRDDESIWYEEDEGLFKTTLDLHGFVETTLREVAEL